MATFSALIVVSLVANAIAFFFISYLIRSYDKELMDIHAYHRNLARKVADLEVVLFNRPAR